MLIVALLLTAPEIHYAVSVRGDKLAVDVDVSADAWGDGATCLCTTMDSAGAAISGLKAREEDHDCFGPFSRTNTHAHYDVDLRKLSDRYNDPDYALRDPVRSAWITNDRAILLRPDGYRAATEIDVTFPLGRHEAIHMNADQLEGGAYILLAADKQRHALEPITFADKQVRITRYRPESGPSDAVLRGWIEKGARGLAEFHGRLPTPMHVIVVPVEGMAGGGIYGTVLRRADASVVLFFGANSLPSEFLTDWVVVHELFHPGIPRIDGRAAWFVEGFTTYYQDILRARLGMITEKAARAAIDDGSERFCQPDGASLREDSEQLRKNGRYQRVYWGGACLADQLEKALSKRGKSFDDIIRAMFKQSEEEPLSESAIVAWFDRETDGLCSRILDEKKKITLAK